MKVAEKSLLLATRNRLRLPIASGGGGYSDSECEVEFDEIAPATVGQVYVAVMTGGWRPGPWHNTSGGVNDLIYGLDVCVIRRIGNVPRDRTRNVFLHNMGSLQDELDRIFTAIDFKEQLRNDANAIILAETGSSEGFVENLRFMGIDKRPRLASSELFAGGGDAAAGMMRTIYFHGCRRITSKT